MWYCLEIDQYMLNLSAWNESQCVHSDEDNWCWMSENNLVVVKILRNFLFIWTLFFIIWTLFFIIWAQNMFIWKHIFIIQTINFIISTIYFKRCSFEPKMTVVTNCICEWYWCRYNTGTWSSRYYTSTGCQIYYDVTMTVASCTKWESKTKSIMW